MFNLNLKEVDMDKIMRLPEVINHTGLARSTIYKLMAANDFPVQIPLGTKSVGWLESDIESWIHERISRSKTEISHSH